MDSDSIHQLKKKLTEILDHLSETLPEHDVMEVVRYMKFGELKLALEMLSEFISERNVTISATVLSLIKILCIELELKDCYWNTLIVEN